MSESSTSTAVITGATSDRGIGMTSPSATPARAGRS